MYKTMGLNVPITGTTSSFTSAMRDAGRSLKTFTVSARRGFGQIKSGFRQLGATVLKFVGVASAASYAIKRLILDVGSNAQEVNNRLKMTFEDNTDAMKTWTKNMGKEWGRSKTDLRDYASGYALLFKSMGATPDEAMEKAKVLTKKTIDLASYYDRPDFEVYEKLKAGLVGMSRSTRTLGIFTKEAQVKQEMLNQGVLKGAKYATEKMKIDSRYRIIAGSLIEVDNDAIRTKQDYGNQVKVFLALLKNLQEEGFLAIAPAVISLMKSLRPLIASTKEWVTANEKLIKIKLGQYLKVAINFVKAAWPPVSLMVSYVGVLVNKFPLIVAGIAGFIVFASPLITMGAGMASIAVAMGGVGKAGWVAVKAFKALIWSGKKVKSLLVGTPDKGARSAEYSHRTSSSVARGHESRKMRWQDQATASRSQRWAGASRSQRWQAADRSRRWQAAAGGSRGRIGRLDASARSAGMASGRSRFMGPFVGQAGGYKKQGRLSRMRGGMNKLGGGVMGVAGNLMAAAAVVEISYSIGKFVGQLGFVKKAMDGLTSAFNVGGVAVEREKERQLKKTGKAMFTRQSARTRGLAAGMSQMGAGKTVKEAAGTSGVSQEMLSQRVKLIAEELRGSTGKGRTLQDAARLAGLKNAAAAANILQAADAMKKTAENAEKMRKATDVLVSVAREAANGINRNQRLATARGLT